jgi:YYY domain-containing protein
MSVVWAWYLLLTLLGWAAVPLANRIFANLPGRGIAFSRPLGLILWGFSFFFLGSLHILPNNLVGQLVTLALFLCLCVWAAWGWVDELVAWWRENLAFFLICEALFLSAFLLWALVRASDPGIYGTEKPMELAFVNAILKSPTLPPHDPWLSGYSISYYYFGYLMVAMIARVTGVNGPAAFNLGIAAWFALTATAAYGVVFALLSKSFQKENGDGRETGSHATVVGLLGPVFILIASNLEGFFDALHQSGWLPASFWQWMNIQEICTAPSPPLAFTLFRPGGLWWWRASRVVHDLDVSQYIQAASGKTCLVGREIIDEFPFFSYLLSDLHPHVLAMPFVLLSVAFALNFYLGMGDGVGEGLSIFRIIRSARTGVKVPISLTLIFTWVQRFDFWLAVICIGGLGFLNTWDFPVEVALVCAAICLRRYQSSGSFAERIIEFIELSLLFGLTAIVLYLPFYIGFTSQAGGLLPSMIFFTRGVHFWVMFGVLLVPVFLWLAWLWRSKRTPRSLRNGIQFGVAGLGGLWVISFLYGGVVSNLDVIGNLLLQVSGGGPGTRYASLMVMLGGLFDQVQGTSGKINLVLFAAVQRFCSPGTWLTLLALLVLAWGLLGRRRTRDVSNLRGSGLVENLSEGNTFFLLVVLLGAALTLFPEFLYLRDQFGWRMNTIFKFYFQTWMLWGIAAAYATGCLVNRLKSRQALFSIILIAIVMASGLVYSSFGLAMKLGQLNWDQLSLNGEQAIADRFPEDLAAIHWLQGQLQGTVAEAVGGSYSDYARVSTYSGFPTVIGWPGHEEQWRGGLSQVGTRQADIQRLYETPSWTEALALIKKYNIRYIYIGTLERNTYQVDEKKFQPVLHPVYERGTVVIYELPQDENIN